MAMEMKRRQFLAAFAATTGATVLAACAPKAEPTAAPAAAVRMKSRRVVRDMMGSFWVGIRD